MSRRLARERAFIIIFQINFHKEFDLDYIYTETLAFENKELKNIDSISDSQVKYIYETSKGTYENLVSIDTEIKNKCKNWSFERLNNIDVGILRLAIFEIMFGKDIPISVAINEAIELGKKFGDDDSPSFINGLLGQFIKESDNIG